MSLITAGHTIICDDKKRVGGVKAIYLANREEIVSYSAAQGNPVATITMATMPNKYFWKFETPPETATWTETYENGETGAFVVLQSIAFDFGKMSQKTATNAKHLYTVCDMVGLVQLYNGEVFIAGRGYGLNVSEGSGTIEASKSGVNRSVLTLVARELFPADTYTGTISSLLSP